MAEPLAGYPLARLLLQRWRSKDSKNAFNALGCGDGNFEQTVLYTVTSISFIPGPKQRLPVMRDTDRPRVNSLRESWHGRESKVSLEKCLAITLHFKLPWRSSIN
jgi:hypothetical protein